MGATAHRAAEKAGPGTSVQGPVSQMLVLWQSALAVVKQRSASSKTALHQVRGNSTAQLQALLSEMLVQQEEL